jgi:outer membrane protein assembly factor BamA
MVRAAVVASLGLAACHPAPPAYPPLAPTCAADRIGTVTVDGASSTEVAGLTVLEGTHDNPARTARIARQTIEALKSHGYARAKLSITPARGCRVDLHVEVALGPQFKIDEIVFVTNDAFPPAAREAAIEDALGGINTIGGVYSADKLRHALTELTQRYHDAGWLEAKIDDPVAHYDDRRSTISVEIPIEAGRRYKIGQVSASGGEPATRAAVMQALGLREGDWYDGETLRMGLERVRRKLGPRGQDIELRTNVSLKRREIDLEAVVEAAK